MTRKEDKLRPYRVDYFDIDEMKENDLALVKSVVVRAVTSEAAVATFKQYPNRIFIRAYRYYKKLGNRRKDVYKPVEDLFTANQALKTMERIEAWRNAPQFATNPPQNVEEVDLPSITLQEKEPETPPVVAPAAPPASATANPNGHFTRYSDSSLYDEVCVKCGATDASGKLAQPCPAAPPTAPKLDTFGHFHAAPPAVFEGLAASDIAGAVKEIIVEMMGIDESEVTPTARFVDDLGADSLDLVELVMRAEEAFGIEIQDDAAEKLVAVQDAIDYVSKAAAPTSGPKSAATKAVIADMQGMLSHDKHEQIMDTFVPDSVPEGKTLPDPTNTPIETTVPAAPDAGTQASYDKVFPPPEPLIEPDQAVGAEAAPGFNRFKEAGFLAAGCATEPPPPPPNVQTPDYSLGFKVGAFAVALGAAIFLALLFAHLAH